MSLENSNNKLLDIQISKRSREIAETSMQGWIPVEPELLTKMQFKLSRGEYNERIDKFILELRNDIGLYSFCLRNYLMDGSMRPDDESPESLLSGIEDIEFWQCERLLDITAEEISPHTIALLPATHIQLLKLINIAVNTAVLMAERAGLKSSFTYSLALLRTLPLALIACSYPTAFTRAFQSQELGFGNLIENFERILNFSYRETLLVMSQRWRLSATLSMLIIEENGTTFIDSDLRSNTDNNIEQNGSSNLNIARNTIKVRSNYELALRFTRISDCITRLSLPEHYPLSGMEWDILKREVMYYLGKHGIAALNDRLALVTKCYIEYHPEIFERKFDPARESQIAISFYNIHRFNRTVEGLGLSEEVKNQFYAVFALLEYRGISIQALKHLFNKLLPELGFAKACIFFYEKSCDLLNPKFQVGEKSLNSFVAVGVATSGDINRLIYDAYHEKGLQRLDRTYSNIITGLHLAIKFTTGTGITGVIYVETNEELRNKGARDLGGYMFAIRQCVCDILGG
jgi:hypothetical protein